MFTTSRGFPFPFGASKHPKGINFSLVSKHAKEISLCLFEPEKEVSVLEIPLNPYTHKTGDVWHIFVQDLPSHYHYGYRIDGPYDPLKGLYYDRRHVMLDPYCKLVANHEQWGAPDPPSYRLRRGAIAPLEPFHWGEDKHPNIPIKDLIIYEMHVRGFTKDPSSNTQHPGTFLGVIEKIPYLKSLGVNAIELLPIHLFDEMQNPYKNPKTKKPLYQYWGYSTVNFFSPMTCYGSRWATVINECKTMVKELHANGIEVILDVVYNHTAEGNQEGPILSFKGIENPTYYMLGPNAEYYDFTGCGNTVNCSHPLVRDLIRDSLRYWVLEMHVDGFRFDLASILTRSHDGIPLQHPPLIEMISMDPILAHTKLIAEPWDAGGLYQVGTFPAMGVFAEWNGIFRDGVKRFLKGTDGAVGSFATRISGSEDLYGKGRSPAHSINFITAHDGFSLGDLVSYNEKHNEENGENNRDGANDNESWNCGVEGETDDVEILALRERQMRNLHLALMVSQGVPMILMGDEYGHTKQGNNNSWGHDSRLNWFQWDTLEKNQGFFRFYQLMIAFRKNHPVLTHCAFLKKNEVTWLDQKGDTPDWHSKSRFLAFVLPDVDNKYELYVAFNAHFTEISACMPTAASPWLKIVDTFQKSPKDFIEEKQASALTSPCYTLPPHSAILLKRKT